MGEVGSKQRDQIGQLLKDLANTIFYKSSANGYYLPNFGKNWATFVSQHLVTLDRTEQKLEARKKQKDANSTNLSTAKC